ncbi:MAG: hypothetical protein K940chlam5_01190 [Candidatus Anoxychlamydiales bacterium]|nr:hypothetical protein [Candidatus Anoxychlamydiales bacterium]
MPKSRPKKIDNLLRAIQDCIISGRYRDTMHAIKRQKQRNIILPEILHVLKQGRHEKGKDRFDEGFNSWNYAIRGWTLDGLDLRVIVSFEMETHLLIITAFYLDKRRGKK